MTRTPRATKSSGNPKQPPAEVQPVVTLKPRRALFFMLLVIFGIWIGFLLGLYFKTVYHRTDVHVETPNERVRQ
jgi:hypothetical protein